MAQSSEVSSKLCRVQRSVVVDRVQGGGQEYVTQISGVMSNLCRVQRSIVDDAKFSGQDLVTLSSRVRSK